MSKSFTSARGGSSAPRTANSSWSSTPQKNWTPSPGNPSKPSDGDHRLLRPHDRGLALVTVGYRPRRGGGFGRRPPRAAHHPGPRAAHAALRQRPRLRREGLRLGRAPLWARAGVHYALQSRAERNDRALLPHAEARVRVAAALPRSRSCLPRRRGLARPLPHGPAALGARLPHAKRVSGAVSGLSCTETRGTAHD